MARKKDSEVDLEALAEQVKGLKDPNRVVKVPFPYCLLKSSAEKWRKQEPKRMVERVIKRAGGAKAFEQKVLGTPRAPRTLGDFFAAFPRRWRDVRDSEKKK